MSLGANVAYVRMNSLAQSISAFKMLSAGGGASYNLGAGLNVVTQADWRTFDAGATIRNQQGYSVTLGLNFSSESIPLSLW